MKRLVLATLAVFLLSVSPALTLGETTASWYQCCSTTANGERFNPDGLTAAHRSLPFGTMVRVTNLGNGLSVTVRINDRGPFVRGRDIDLSRGAARAIGCINSGTCRVRMEIVG